MMNLNWLNDYINISEEDVHELAVKITKAGVNIEDVVTNRINNLVIGQIKTCEMHPDSDHLHVCNVDVGSEVVQIVCGASNVRENLKVIVALPGAVLPGNFEIKKGKIRGVESNGMICALFELGLEAKTEETYAKGIEELSDDAVVGKDPISFLGLEETLYEVDIHKHRNNDCYYHIGFAYEVGAILNKEIKLPEDNYEEIAEKTSDSFELEVQTEKCPYYIAKLVKNVEIKESPDFIKKRLLSVGMKPINNVVDISNYVMLEYGQPMHFFDKDKVGNKILVREALEDEEIITLDGQKRILNEKDIVITDSKKAICIAGVMGGENTEVTEDTKNILIESAMFDGINIRNTANRLALRSEASIRYGKGLNFEYTKKAMNRACHLLEKYANATICSGTVEHDVVDKTAKEVEFKTADINKMLGILISDSDVKEELGRLKFNYELNDETFSVEIPSRRLDIEPNINDIAEEIGRLYGYHNLVSTLPVVGVKRGEYVGDVKYRKLISSRLRALGLNEAKNYTLVSPAMAEKFNYENVKQVVLPNPMSIDKSVVRTSLIPSLINVYEYNKTRKVNDILLYEISKVYNENLEEDIKIAVLISGKYISNNWQHNEIKCDFYILKGIVENVLDYLGLKNRYTFNKSDVKDLSSDINATISLDRNNIGIIGKVNPMIIKDEVYVAELSISKMITKIKPIKYKEATKYPEIQKDLAFIVKKDIDSYEIVNEIKKVAGRLLSTVDIFDVYIGDKIGENEKSIAFNLIYSDSTRTLNEEEVMVSFNNVIEKIENKFEAKLRNK